MFPKMEKQLASAVDELKAMRQDLEKMKNHPLKSALQKSIVVLQDRILALRDSLAELKAGIIEGCKNTLTAVKERGISALDHAARFFHIAGATALRNSINEGIQADEKAISRIEAVSAEYHEAGRHVKNIGRALMGKEAVQEAEGSRQAGKDGTGPLPGGTGLFPCWPGTVWIRRLPVLNGWNVPPKDSLLS
ncbi:MAG: DUF6674 family protein [Enterocloster bolteae]